MCVGHGGGARKAPNGPVSQLALPWTVTVTSDSPAVVGSVVAQGDMRPFDAGDNAKGGATREALDDIRRILASREALYARADAVVDTLRAHGVPRELREAFRALRDAK